MSDNKEINSEDNNITHDGVKAAKDFQITATYYPLLLLVAIIALFKIPGPGYDDNVKDLCYWIIGIIALFSVIYHIHTSCTLWQYRNRLNINQSYKKVLLIIYTVLHLSLVFLITVMTYHVIIASSR